MEKRIAGRAENKRVERWLESQGNLNQSLNNIISHMIRIFGYRDITEYEVQEFLFTQILENEFIPKKQGKETYNNPSDLNWLFLSKAHSKITSVLKDVLYVEKDGFNVVISNHDEYKKELDEIEEITVVEKSETINSSNIAFSEQMKMARNVSIERNKTLYIVTEIENNGFSKESYREFIKHLYLEQYKHYENERENLVPIRVILDGGPHLINSLPSEVVDTCRRIKMAFIASTNSVKELNPEAIINIHKKHL